MKAYIWEWADGVTSNYHSGGGVLIVTSGDPIEAWREHAANDGADPAALDGSDPDITLDVTDTEPRLVVFPDAGCC